MDPDRNIVLIGMPAAGKSTVGVLLAKELRRDFLDVDVCIQAAAGRSLQEIIDRRGLRAFRRLEERHVLGLRCRRSVIATGGSVVYSEPAMRHMASGGVVVHLALPLADLAARLEHLEERGVVIEPGQSLADLYAERTPLYRRWADVTVDCAGLDRTGAVAAVVRALEVDGSGP